MILPRTYLSALVSPWSHTRYRSISGGIFHRLRLQKCLQVCRSIEAAEALEIGCHDLHFYQLLKKKFVRYVGLDRQPYMSHLAGRGEGLSGRVIVRQGLAEAMPFESATFDLVMAFETIQHLADEKRGLAEITRVVRPGGKIVLSLPIEFGLLRPLKSVARWLGSDRSASAERTGGRYDYRQTLEQLLGQGLHILRTYRLPVMWLPGWLNAGLVVVLEKPTVPVASNRPQVLRGPHKRTISQGTPQRKMT
jgi:SAM-dependent methyltransferase